MTADQETNLIKQIQQGDKDSFRLFIDQYQKLVFHIVYKTCSSQKDLDDLCQDIFIKTYRNINSFRHECKVSTWVAKIAYNTCLNYLKKKKVILFDDVTPDYTGIDDMMGESSMPDEFLEQQDISKCLAEAMAHIPENYRTILTLYHIDEMQYSEIGKIMDLPAGTVKNYLFRARNILKKELLKMYQKEELWQ